MSSSATSPEERAAVKKKIAAGPFGRKTRANTRFPQPRFRTLTFNKARYLFEYWQAIPKEHQDLIEVRSYRLWPQIKMELAEPDRRDHAWEIIHGACPFEPDAFEVGIMQRTNYGSGDYRFDLKEIGTDEILIRAYVHAIDLTLYPPVIDLSTLVNVPANQEYIRGLMKQNKKLPWEYEPEEDDEMAGTGVAEAMKMMSETVSTVSKLAIDGANARAEDARAAVDELRQENSEQVNEEPGEQIEQAAVVRSLDLLSHAAEKGMDMLSRQQSDPIAMMNALKAWLPANDGSGTQVVLTTLREMQTENMKFLKEVMDQRAAPATAAATDPFAMMLEKGTQMKAIADLFGWGPADRERDEPPPAPAAPRAPEKTLGQQIGENIVPIVTGLSAILTMGANIFYNMKLAPGAAPRNPAEDMAAAAQQNPLNAMNGHVPGMPPQQPVAAMPVDPLEEFKPFIVNVSNALMKHFFGTDEELNGYTFAEWVLSAGNGGNAVPDGRRAYGMVKERLGRERFDQLVREYFPLWSKIQGMPVQYQRFLDEFFGYDEWARQQEPVV